MCATSEGAGEMRGYAGSPEPSLVAYVAGPGRLCDKYHNLMSWLKYVDMKPQDARKTSLACHDKTMQRSNNSL